MNDIFNQVIRIHVEHQALERSILEGTDVYSNETVQAARRPGIASRILHLFRVHQWRTRVSESGAAVRACTTCGKQKPL